MRQTELAHIYRALKLLKRFYEDYPEEFDQEEEEDILIGWEVINTHIVGRYPE